MLFGSVSDHTIYILSIHHKNIFQVYISSIYLRGGFKNTPSEIELSKNDFKFCYILGWCPKPTLLAENIKITLLYA